MRKVYVNAYVKAMITLLETFSNIVYAIVVYFTVRTSFLTLIILTIMYMIILPYAFLMNTSNNKEQVVEHGWVYVFKNVSRKSGETKFSKGGQAMKKIHNKPSKLPYDNENQEIFATSSSAISKVRNKEVSIHQKVRFENEPCSSKGQSDTNKRHHTDITRLDVNLLPQHEHKTQSISQRLIGNMIEQLHEE
jgi:hypothetical protein